ncbi:hypothetical protein DMH88_02465 [Escherichia coli]|nr:hypothetical protein [Escherichia coli]
MRKHNNGRSGVNVKSKNSMAVPMREATRTLLRELIGVYSCSWSSVVAVACIIFFLFFWLTNSHITHSKK